MLRPLASFIVASFAVVSIARAQSWGAKPYGILLLGHGGSTVWNQSILDVQKAVADKKIPIELAFGMADSVEIQVAVNRLQDKHVQKIVAVPLFVSSHSEVIEQTKYVLGMRKTPSKEFMDAPHAHMTDMLVNRAKIQVPIVLTSALDDNPVVADILLDRAKEMSRDPSKEYVILVGHGPLKDDDNELWLSDMNHLALAVKERGGFAGAYAANLRDDALPDVRTKADKILRDLVGRLSRQGRVLVVPELIASGGIERDVVKSLDGMFYSWTGKTLLPDPRITQWVIETAQKGSVLPGMQQFKDEGRPLPPPDRKHIVPVGQS